MFKEPASNPLPNDFGEERDHYLEPLEVAYAGLETGRVSDRAAWSDAQREYIQYVQHEYERVGLTAPRWMAMAYWRRLQRFTPAKDPDEHLWTLRAVLTDCHDDFWAQFDDRWLDAGNVQARAAGPTGMRKSSSLLRVMEDWAHRLRDRYGTDAPLDVDHLERHLTIDVSEIPELIRPMRPGQSALRDEKSRTAGQGSKTQDDVVRNIQEQLRASQVYYFEATPEIGELDAVTQAVLEFRWNNRQDHWSLALMHLEGQIHGVKGFPWATPRTFNAYTPIKAANVERARAAAFGDIDFLVRILTECTKDPRFVAFLASGKKPTKVNIQTALRLFQQRTIASTDSDAIADFAFALWSAWDRMGPNFKQWFGVEPTEGMQAIGKKFYQE